MPGYIPRVIGVEVALGSGEAGAVGEEFGGAEGTFQRAVEGAINEANRLVFSSRAASSLRGSPQWVVNEAQQSVGDIIAMHNRMGWINSIGTFYGGLVAMTGLGRHVPGARRVIRHVVKPAQRHAEEAMKHLWANQEPMIEAAVHHHARLHRALNDHEKVVRLEHLDRLLKHEADIARATYRTLWNQFFGHTDAHGHVHPGVWQTFQQVRHEQRLEHDRVMHHIHHLQGAVDQLWSEVGTKPGQPSQHLVKEVRRLREDQTRLGHYVHHQLEPEVRTLREQLRAVREELKHFKQPRPKGQPYPDPWPRLRQEQREIEKLKGGKYADPWPRISHEEHQLQEARRELIHLRARVRALEHEPHGKGGLSPAQAHQLHRANHFAVALAPLLALAPIGVAEVARLARFASGRCGCTPNVSIPNIAVDAAIADQLIINGI